MNAVQSSSDILVLCLIVQLRDGIAVDIAQQAVDDVNHAVLHCDVAMRHHALGTRVPRVH